jgi:Meiotically up-regulated gene 113
MPIGRDEIIAEIHKFVAANDGEIPGERTFVAATRIKQSAWKGRYWARWTDAVREAGYDPNSMTQKIPEDDILAHLATFITELGYFPFRDEFNMRARTIHGFPVWDTIRKRYGGMPETASALLDFSRRFSNPALEKLCTERLERESIKLAPASNGERIKPSKVGYVYLKYSPSLRLYKIGKANNPTKRGAGISLLLPEDLVPKHEIRTDYPFILEKYWENRFRDKRKQGEWYELSTADIKAFKARREFMFGEYFP